jgi:hypothetical protein
MAGTNNCTYRAGLGVPDYGYFVGNTNGYIILTADQSNAPYLQMATHLSNYTSNDANGSLISTPRLRVGNLNGSYGLSANTWGFATGEYGVAGQSWVIVATDPGGDPTKSGVRIGNNLITRIHLKADGSGFLASTNISWDISGNTTIAGWTITATALKAGTGAATVGLDSTVTGGDDVRIYAGSATPTSAPFRVTEAGALVATNATITGAITATSGSFTGSVTAASGSIAGWTIAATQLTSTGIAINSGASAGLAFGTTPPTSAASGTGIWLDRTGLYGLASSAVQAKLDAATGAITAGAGMVKLDANGIRMTQSSTSFLNWFSGIPFFSLTGQDASGEGLGVISVFAISSGNPGSLSILAGNYNTQSVNRIELRNSATAATLSFFVNGNTPSPLSIVVGADGFNFPAPASTIFEIRSTTGAFLLPRLTTTQKNALTKTNGMMVFDTNTGKVEVVSGGAWVAVH